MTILIIGLALFFSAHLYSAFRSRSPERDIKDKFGKATYMGIYSLVSFVGLALIICGYSTADVTATIIPGFSGARNAVFILMLPALILITSSNLPISHIKTTVKHPMLIAVALWSIAHILDGANLKQLLLFGSFLLFSLIDIVAVSLRQDKQSQTHPEPKIKNDILVLAVATLAYCALIYGLHEWLLGVSLNL